MEKRKLIAIALAVAMTTAMFAGCSGENTPSSSESSSSESSSVAETPADPIKATGVVKEMSMNELVVTLEDGSDITLKADGLEGLDSIALGDTVEVEYTEDEDGAVATSVKAAGETEDTESSSTDEEQSSASGAQNPTNSSSEAQTPASQPSGNAASSQSGQASASSAGVNRNASQMSEKERAEALMKLMDLEVLDWVTPANELTAGMNQFIFSCSDFNNSGSIIAYINGSDWGEDDLKAYGYYYPEASILGWVKAFNDYRGVETDVVVYGGLDDSLENWYGYQYDEASDSFEEVLIPVGGNGSTTSDSNKATDETASGSKNEGNNGSKAEESGSNKAEANDAGDVYEAIDLINAERVKAGLNELEVDEDLMEMAAVRVEEMTEVFAHTRPDGTRYTTIFEEFGWGKPSSSCENGGSGTNRASAATQVEAWMNSSGHKANILKDNVTKIGVGYAYSNGTHYWTMLAAS